MSSFEIVLPDENGDFKKLPKEMIVLWSTSKLEDAIVRNRESEYCYPVTFTVHENIMTRRLDDSPDVEVAKIIMDHIFFFRGPMDKSWAHDIATEFQGYGAKYIGLEQVYVNREEYPLQGFVSAEFSPNELAAWMRLFWDWNNPTGFSPRDPQEFFNLHGSNKENYL